VTQPFRDFVKSSRRSIDAVALLTTYMALLLFIPATEVFSPLGAAGGPPTLFAVVLFLAYLWTWFDPESKLDRAYQPVRLLGLAFTCIMIASWVSANRHALPTLQRNAADRALISVAGWFGVLLIAADGINTMQGLRTLIRRLVNGVTVVAAVGMLQFFTTKNLADYIKIPGLHALALDTNLITRGSFIRPQSTASHPIEFGAVLAITLPLAIYQARFAAPDKRWWRWAQVAIIAGTAPLTVSRSAILGLIVVGLVILPTWPKRDRRVAYVVIVLFVLATWVAVPGLVGTIRGLFESIGSDSSTMSRTSALSAAPSLIAQHPWLGMGPSTLLPATYFYVDDQYLTSVIETGILGLLALVSLFVVGWLVARNTRRLSSDPESRQLAQCFAACSVVAAVSFATYDALSFPMATSLTFLVIGLNGAHWRLSRTAQRPPAATVSMRYERQFASEGRYLGSQSPGFRS
jgi:polysaccharide biosynthesis protein PslJ